MSKASPPIITSISSEIWLVIDKDYSGVEILAAFTTEQLAKDLVASDIPSAEVAKLELHHTMPAEVKVETMNAVWKAAEIEPKVTRSTHMQRFELPPPVVVKESPVTSNTGLVNQWVIVSGTDLDKVDEAFSERVAAIIAERMGIA